MMARRAVHNSSSHRISNRNRNRGAGSGREHHGVHKDDDDDDDNNNSSSSSSSTRGAANQRKASVDEMLTESTDGVAKIKGKGSLLKQKPGKKKKAPLDDSDDDSEFEAQWNMKFGKKSFDADEDGLEESAQAPNNNDGDGKETFTKKNDHDDGSNDSLGSDTEDAAGAKKKPVNADKEGLEESAKAPNSNDGDRKETSTTKDDHDDGNDSSGSSSVKKKRAANLKQKFSTDSGEDSEDDEVPPKARFMPADNSNLLSHASSTALSENIAASNDTAPPSV